jgi:hypothetical protein
MPQNSNVNIQQVTEEIQHWLEGVVIGLNLCPFAAAPYRNQQIKIQVSTAHTNQQLLEDLVNELRNLDHHPQSILETTLLVTPLLLSEFEEYNEFLGTVDDLLSAFGWEGEYQIASFHPDYYFADTHRDDAENLTNRSPYPILHVLREESVSAALATFINPEAIPTANIQTMRQLSPQQIRALFPFLANPLS